MELVKGRLLDSGSGGLGIGKHCLENAGIEQLGPIDGDSLNLKADVPQFAVDASEALLK